MHATSLQSFYAAAAGVAGALIGLLFVAVSVAHEGPVEEARTHHQIPAAAALSAFTNALAVALLGLIEGGDVATPAAAAAVAGLTFVCGAVLSIVRRGRIRFRDAAILSVLAVMFAAEGVIGFTNTAHPGAPGVQQAVAMVIVGCFLTGISRSWELIGARRIGLVREIGALVHPRGGAVGPAGGAAAGSSSVPARVSYRSAN